jgi:hypothetical protein
MSEPNSSLRVNGGHSFPQEGNRSPPRNCSHEALPFVEAAAKAKLAGSVETQPGDHLAAFSAFRIIDVPIMAARNKDVRREWVVFGFHCRKLGFDITYRHSESFQCIFKACRPHDCSIEHIGCGASSGRATESRANGHPPRLHFLRQLRSVTVPWLRACLLP